MRMFAGGLLGVLVATSLFTKTPTHITVDDLSTGSWYLERLAIGAVDKWRTGAFLA